METELELKLREVEAAIQFHRRHLISSQSLMTVLIDLYNLLENLEAEKRMPALKKKGKEKEGK
jgi:hypothetical protein